MGSFVDPKPIIEKQFKEALGELRHQLGDPKTIRQKIRLRWAVARLRRRHYGYLRWTVKW